MDEQERKDRLERLRESGRKGGQSTAARHGRDHFSKIGKAGAEAIKKMWGKTSG